MSGMIPQIQRFVNDAVRKCPSQRLAIGQNQLHLPAQGQAILRCLTVTVVLSGTSLEQSLQGETSGWKVEQYSKLSDENAILSATIYTIVTAAE